MNMTSNDDTPLEPTRTKVIRSSPVAMSDVARVAGVSAQTVSNVLRAPHRVAPATIERVRRAITDLDYHPNSAAATLKSGRTNVIGYTIHPNEEEFTTERSLTGFLDEFLNGLVSAAAPAGFSVLVTAADPRHELDVYRRLISSHRVDAMVLSETVPGDKRAAFLAERQFPFVAFGRTAPDLPQTWVDIDNEAAMGPVVDHLVERGCRRLGYLGSANQMPWVRQRLRGFQAQLRRHDMEPGGIIKVHDADDVEEAVSSLLDMRPAIDAISTDTDALATNVMRALRGHGIAPGFDVAVTGFNDFPYAYFLDPPLTSVRIPLREIARTIFTRVTSLIAGNDDPDQGILVDAPLIVRASTMLS
jgi:DNA-binding LacI/PurR family transcriptional regulator